ncbi:MAG: hypothetical protein MHMPM18_001363, partial [Marteilia pararefringens]
SFDSKLSNKVIFQKQETNAARFDDQDRIQALEESIRGLENNIKKGVNTEGDTDTDKGEVKQPSGPGGKRPKTYDDSTSEI